VTVRLRLSDRELADPWGEFGPTMDLRRTEADEFDDELLP